MTRITQLKLLKKLNPKLAADPEFQRETAPGYYPCPVCGETMVLSPGQIQACHRDCKEMYKRLKQKVWPKLERLQSETPEVEEGIKQLLAKSEI